MAIGTIAATWGLGSQIGDTFKARNDGSACRPGALVHGMARIALLRRRVR
jgi:hypothetical protein